MNRKSERGQNSSLKIFGGQEIILMASEDFCQEYGVSVFYCEELPEASLLEKIKDKGLIISTRLNDPREVLRAAYLVDLLYLGWELLSCKALLKEIGQNGTAVILERGSVLTIEEVLRAAFFLREAGSKEVNLCAGGIRSFEYPERCPLDLSAVPVWKHLGDFPVVVNPGSFNKYWGTAVAMSKAAIAAGADGLFFSDPPQKECFRNLLEELRQVAFAVGRRVACRKPEGSGNYTLEVRKGVANFDY